MAPWAFFLPLAVRLPDREPEERDLDRLCWFWIAAIVLFFSLSASKRTPYILPVAPAVAVLVAGLAERFLGERLERWRSIALRSVLGGLALLLLVGGLYFRLALLDDYPLIHTAGQAVSLLLVGVGAATLAGLFVMRRTPAAAAAFFSGILCLYLSAAIWLLPEVDVYKSARPFCTMMNEEVVQDAPLASYRQWKWRASYIYYADRTIRKIGSADELRDYWARPERVYLVVEQARLDEVRAILGSPEPLFSRRIGSREVYLFANR
jgi:4-amino-4-deoxy-L-arabinose transferase-like glycosyltransferase